MMMIAVVAMVAVAMGSIPTCHAAPRLANVQVIARHGARHPLFKTSSDSDNSYVEFQSPTLTPLGLRQTVQLGEWLADNYHETLTNAYNDNNNGDSGNNSNNDGRIRMESSALERTLVSANAIGIGMWSKLAEDYTSPNETSLFLPSGLVVPEIPIYSRPLSDDVQIRAYDKCVALHHALDALYTQDAAWLALEQQHRAFLHQLGNIANFRAWAVPSRAADGTFRIRLQDAWNVYDAVHVARTECSIDSDNNDNKNNKNACNELDDALAGSVLTDAEFAKLEEIAHQAEWLKYTSSKKGNRARWIGYNLLQTIFTRMTTTDEYDFVLYSAHYPTMLGVLSALGYANNIDDIQDDDTFVGPLPDYASALLLEYYTDSETNEGMFQVLYRPNATSIDAIPLESLCQPGSRWCTLDDFQHILREWSLSDWCQECQAIGTNLCMIGTNDNSDGSGNFADEGGNNGDTVVVSTLGDDDKIDSTRNNNNAASCDSPRDEQLWLGFGLGFLANAILMALGWTFLGGCCCRRRRRRSSNSKSCNATPSYRDTTAVDLEEELSLEETEEHTPTVMAAAELT